MLKLLTVVASMSGAVSANCPCDIPEYRALVASTKERIEARGEFRVPVGFFHPARRYGCALVAFEITPEGAAKNIQTVVSHPTRAIASSAKLALDEYRFGRVLGDSGVRGALIFEAIAEDD